MTGRRWVNASVTAGFSYWNCPGMHCSEVVWQESIPAPVLCLTCGFSYQAIRLEEGRLLIEVKK